MISTVAKYVVTALVLGGVNGVSIPSNSSNNYNVSLQEQFEDKLTPMLDRMVKLYEIGISFAVRTQDGEGNEVSYAFAGGPADKTSEAQKNLTSENVMPVESHAMLWTCMSVMQLVEQGKMNLDDKLHTYVDGLIAKNMNYSSMQDLFDNQIAVNNITIYQALHMTSGIQDYVLEERLNQSFVNMTYEPSPYDYLQQVNKTLLFPPGQTTLKGGSYSSISVTLVSLALANVLSDGDWEAFIPMQFPSALGDNEEVKQLLLPNFKFLGRGKCSQHEEIPQLYMVVNDRRVGGDMWMMNFNNASCMFGFGFANVATNSVGITDLFDQLFNKKTILNETSVANILDLTDGAVIGVRGLEFGMGVEAVVGDRPDPWYMANGEAYGSNTLNQWLPGINVSLSGITNGNQHSGLNASMGCANKNYRTSFVNLENTVYNMVIENLGVNGVPKSIEDDTMTYENCPQFVKNYLSGPSQEEIEAWSAKTEQRINENGGNATFVNIDFEENRAMCAQRSYPYPTVSSFN